MVKQTNTRYVKKSPGSENLGEAVSSLLPYVYTIWSQPIARYALPKPRECLRKYVSNMMPKSLPVRRNDVTNLQTCGGSFQRYGR